MKRSCSLQTLSGLLRQNASYTGTSALFQGRPSRREAKQGLRQIDMFGNHTDWSRMRRTRQHPWPTFPESSQPTMGRRHVARKPRWAANSLPEAAR